MIAENRAELEKSGVLWWRERGFGGRGMTVAVIDTGGLEDIQKDYASAPLSGGRPGHGANCCGVIHEVAPGARVVLLPDTAAGAEYILGHGIKLVSISRSNWGHANHLLPLRGKVVMFASAGNQGKDELKGYPASYDWTLAVGAYIEATGKMASYSNAGEKLDITSFTNIYLPHDGGRIGQFTGTSCACPFAAGMLALAWGACRELGFEPTIGQMMEYVKSNCRDILEPGRDNQSGWGLFALPQKLPKKVVLTLDSAAMLVNGIEVPLDVPMTAINGRTMIPLRAVSEALGAGVEWDNIKKQAVITLI